MLAQHPAVSAAVVVAREDAALGRYLAAYLTVREPAPSVRELRAFVRGRLPEPLVPAALVILDLLPLTPHGKVDRQQLPPPGPDSFPGESGFVAPRTPVEEALAALFAELLGRDRVGIHDNFFELGGHSLLALQVVARARLTLGVDLPLASLFETATVAGLARRVATPDRALITQPPTPLAAVPRDRPFPLTHAQQRHFWASAWRGPLEHPLHNVSRAFRLQGPLCVEALQQALQALIARHEALRTTFAWVEGNPVQIVGPARPLELLQKDLSLLPVSQRLDEAQRLVDEQLQRSFDLAHDLMPRATLLRLAPDDHVFLVSMHHLLTDGWSLGILYRELEAFYGAWAAGKPLRLPDPALQLADFACWQHERSRGEPMQAHLRYWKKQLVGIAEAVGLPHQGPKPTIGTLPGRSQELLVPAGVVETLRELGRQEGCTLPMTFLAALNILLHRELGCENVFVTVNLSGRVHPDVAEVVGYFVAKVILRTNLAGQPTFREVLHRVREVASEAYAHQEAPLHLVLSQMPEMDPSNSDLLVVFNFTERSRAALGLSGLKATRMQLNPPACFPPFHLYLTEEEEGLALRLAYARSLYPDDQIHRFLSSYRTLLEGLADLSAPRRHGPTSLGPGDDPR